MKKLLALLLVLVLCSLGCNKDASQQTDKQVGSPSDKGDRADQEKVQKPDDKEQVGKADSQKVETAKPATKAVPESPLYKGKPASFWIKQLKDRDATFRLDAVKALREIGTDGDGVVLALVQTLADKEPTVRDASHEAIRSLPLENRIPALVQVLRGKEKSTRAAVIVLLGEIGPKAKAALPDLTKALEDEDALARSKAATAVGKIGVPEKAALTGLTKLVADKDISVRHEAIKALGKIEKDTELAIPSLLERLSPKKEEDASIRLEAVKTLWIVGKQDEKVLSAILLACNDPDEVTSKEARAVVSRVEVKNRVPLLSKALKTDDNKTRLLALHFLVEIGAEGKDAVPAVVDVLKSENEDVRIHAAKMLGKVGKNAGTATPALITLLADKSAQVRLEAAKALKSIPISEKLPALTAALKDKNAEIRANAVGELQEVGPDAKSAVPALIALLDEKALRVSAAKALGKIGPDAKAAIPILAKLLDEADEALRTTALASLRNLGSDAKVAVLIGSLKDKEAEVRQQAATGLAELGPKAKAAIPALARALDDPNTTVCDKAASALAAMGKEGVPPLVEFLKGKSKDRECAAKALGKIGPDAKEAIPTLAKLLDDDDEVLQSAATAALRNLGPEGKLPALIGSLKDQNWEVRVKAAKELGTMGLEAKSAIPALVTAFAKAHRPYGGLYWYEGRDLKEGCRVHEAYSTALRNQGRHDVPCLVETLQKNKDNQLVVGIVASTLAEISLPGAKPAIPALRELLQDKRCRVSAALGLVQLGGSGAKQAVPALLEILAGEGSFEVQEAFLKSKSKAEALARCQKAQEEEEADLKRQGFEPRVRVERLIEQVRVTQDKNRFLRKMAAEALRRMGKDAIPPLIVVLKGKSSVRPYAAIALSKLGADAKAAVPILVDLVQDADCREAAAVALGQIGGRGRDAKAAVPMLVKLLGDNDEVVQATVATSLKNLGKDAVLPLIEYLKSGTTDQKVLAAGALGEIGPDAKAAVSFLVDLLQDDKYREATALALGRIGGLDAKKAIPTLEKLLDDDDELMRRAAATALGKVGKDAVPALLEALKKKGDKRVLAAYALGEIGPDAKAAIPPLVGLLNDKGKVVRMTAATALGKLGNNAVAPLAEYLKGDCQYPYLAVYALGEIGPAAKNAVPLLLDMLEKERGTGEAGAKGREAKDRKEKLNVRRSVFLNPGLLKVSPFDGLLESDATTADLAAIALGKVSDADSKEFKAAVRFLKAAVGRKRAKRGEGKEGQGRGKEMKAVSRTAIIIRAFEQGDDAEESEARQFRQNLAPLAMTRMLARLAPKEVETLNLSETPTTDLDLKETAVFTNLVSLDLRGTQVSDAGVAELRKALPKAKIQK